MLRPPVCFIVSEVDMPACAKDVSGYIPGARQSWHLGAGAAIIIIDDLEAPTHAGAPEGNQSASTKTPEDLKYPSFWEFCTD